tara:strand:- start:951 stop:1613 length:663 start_codon:yes stop_codon:yes gene_type:complete
MNSEQIINIVSHGDDTCTLLIHSPSIEVITEFDFKETSLGNKCFCLKTTACKVIDIIGKIFEHPEEIFEKYPSILNLIQSTKCVLTREDAVLPSKASPSDSGYDLTLVDTHKQVGKVTLYNTGVKVQPPYGVYFDLVPRSSIIKSGYMLANSVGIIDQGYTGEILVPLIKVDPDAPDLQLPNKIAQLIPRNWMHTNVIKVDSLEVTTRNEGGFGSTDLKK